MRRISPTAFHQAHNRLDVSSGLLTGAARNLTAAARRQLDVMNVCAHGIARSGSALSQIGREHHRQPDRRANAKTVRSEDEVQLAVAIL
jgi:hypothetical protein